MSSSEKRRSREKRVVSTVRPIIVVGIDRSGTKWLSNLLAAHPRIAAVQAPQHRGLIETNMFGNMQRSFGDLRRAENYVALIEAWAATDFFRCAGGDKTAFYALRPRPVSYVQLLRTLMDDFARRQRCDFWVQKVSPGHAAEVVGELPDAVVLTIERDSDAVTRSSLALAARTGSNDSALRCAARIVHQTRLLRRLQHSVRAHRVTYEALQENAQAALAGPLRALGLNAEPGMFAEPLPRNSSFSASESEPGASLDNRAIAWSRLFRHALAPIPTPALDWLRRARTRRPAIVPGSYTTITRQHDLR